ncbi:hypothetical protein ACIQK5_10210 [Streptomyces virginiae]|uniref:hypothetical protein n=1 Tax=Streptomyces virginiae TaxID=1961 RepID=UPI003807399A
MLRFRLAQAAAVTGLLVTALTLASAATASADTTPAAAASDVQIAPTTTTQNMGWS